MSLIPRVKLAGWSTNELLLSTQMTPLDENVNIAGDYIERLSTIPFHSPHYLETNPSGSGSSRALVWCQRTGADGRSFWALFDNSGSTWVSYSGGQVFEETSIASDTIFDAYDDGVTCIVVGNTDGYAFNLPSSVATLTGITGRAVFNDGTKWIISSVSVGFRYNTSGVTFTTSTPPTNWGAGSNAASQFASDGDIVVAVPDTGTQKAYFAFSEDHGVTWDEFSVSDKTWTGIAYRPASSPSGALWVAVATDAVYTSDDGENWVAAVTNLVSGKFPAHKVFVLNDWFVTVTSNDDIIFSKDAETWYQGDRVSAASYTMSDFAVGAGNIGGVLAQTSNPTLLWTTQRAPLLSLVEA